MSLQSEPLLNEPFRIVLNTYEIDGIYAAKVTCPSCDYRRDIRLDDLVKDNAGGNK